MIYLRVQDPGTGWNARARGNPVVVSQFQPELVVENPQVPIATMHDRIWHDGLHLLRDHADIDFVAAVVAEAIEAKPIIELADQAMSCWR